jgi:hypothetical protein
MQPTVALTILTAVMSCSACTSQVPTVDAPESKQLASRIDGYIVWTLPRGGISTLSLPGMSESVVRPAAPEEVDVFATVHSLNGPDSSGRIAYIEDHFFVASEKERKHVLKTVRIDGTNEVQIFERSGSAMWSGSLAGRGEIGLHLALAPSGDKVAFLSGLTAKQMPGLLWNAGSIEIWDVRKKARITTVQPAIDSSMSWLPDGKRLCYVRLVARGELPQPAAGLNRYDDFLKSWDEVPAVYVFDLDSGQSRFLHVGWLPIVASDGKTALVGGWISRSEMAWSRVDMQKGESNPVRWPGDAQGAIAVVEDDLVVYWGWPTEGAQALFTEHNSHPRGRKPMLTIKVALLDSGEYQTLMPHLDPRARVCFGRFPR